MDLYGFYTSFSTAMKVYSFEIYDSRNYIGVNLPSGNVRLLNLLHNG